jgi:hypothetical protein
VRTPLPDGHYLPLTIRLRGGEHFAIRAEGAELPPFEHRFDQPVAVILTAPVVPEGATEIPVSRDADLHLTWERGVEGQWVQVGGYAPEDGAYERMVCMFPAGGGEGVFPREFLARFPETTLSIVGMYVADVPAGEHIVKVLSMSSVHPPEHVLPIRFVLAEPGKPRL